MLVGLIFSFLPSLLRHFGCCSFWQFYVFFFSLVQMIFNVGDQKFLQADVIQELRIKQKKSFWPSFGLYSAGNFVFLVQIIFEVGDQKFLQVDVIQELNRKRKIAKCILIFVNIFYSRYKQCLSFQFMEDPYCCFLA